MTGLHRLGLATTLAALVCGTAAVAGGPGTALAASAGAVSGGAVSGRAVPDGPSPG